MRRILLVLAVSILILGCTPFQLDSKYEKCLEKEESITLSDLIADAMPTDKEITSFKIKTGLNYKEVIANNREKVYNVPILADLPNINIWNERNIEIEKLMYKDFNSGINPQKDAQKYMNLMLSLVQDIPSYYEVIVLEAGKAPKQFPGKYILITRGEIEKCSDERQLIELLITDILANQYMNNKFIKEIKSGKTTEEAISLAQEDFYSGLLNQDEFLLEVSKFMARSGFEPKHELNNAKKLMFFKPLMRHKKVFE